jgi:hypothetical protein
MYGPVYGRKAFVEFFDEGTASEVYSYYNDHKEITASWGVDKSKSKGWTAVVVRNLPPGCTISTIMRNFSKSGERIKSIMEIKRIKGQCCTIVVTESLKDAEEICFKHNGEKLNPLNKLKVHLHPHISLLTQPDSLPHNEFLTNINQDMEMIKESVKKSEVKNKEKVTKLPTELKQNLISYFDEYDKKRILNSAHKTKDETTTPHKGKSKDSFNQDTKSSHMQDIKSPYKAEKHYVHGNGYEEVKEYQPDNSLQNGKNSISRDIQGLEEREILVDDKYYTHDKAKYYKKEKYDCNRRHHYDDYHHRDRRYRSNSRDRSRYSDRRTRDYYFTNYERNYSLYNIMMNRRSSRHKYSRRDRSKE